MHSSRVLAIDFGAGHVVCAAFAARSDGRLALEQLAVEPLDSDPATEACWIERARASLVRMSGRFRAGLDAGMAVPGHLVLTKSVQTPAIPKSKRRRVVEFEASRNIPYPLDEVVWDHLVMADDGPDLEMLLMAVKRDTMLALCDTTSSARCSPQLAIPSCVALCRSFRFNYPEAPAGALLANIGARSTQLLLFESQRFFVRTFALGGNAITQSIAQELHVEFARAEALKIDVLSGKNGLPEAPAARARVLRAAEQFGLRLHSEITRSMAGFQRQHSATKPTAIFLAGGGSSIATLPGLLGDKLGVPVQRFEPLRRIVAAGAAGEAAGASAMLAEVVGLATHLVGQAESGPGLLPAPLRRAATLRRRQPVLLAAAAILAFALLAPIWRYHRQISAIETESIAIEARLRPLRSIAQRNASNLAQLERTRKQLATLQGLAASKSSWLLLLADLQSRLVQVEDVWLEKLSIVLPPAAETAGTSGNSTEPALRLAIGGRLLDAANPLSATGAGSRERAKRLLAELSRSRFVAAVEGERFDNSQPEILRFECMLLVNPGTRW